MRTGDYFSIFPEDVIADLRAGGVTPYEPSARPDLIELPVVRATQPAAPDRPTFATLAKKPGFDWGADARNAYLPR